MLILKQVELTIKSSTLVVNNINVRGQSGGGGIDSLGADCRTVSNGPSWDNELIIFNMNFRPSLKFFRLLHKGDNLVYLVYNVSLIIL